MAEGLAPDKNYAIMLSSLALIMPNHAILTEIKPQFSIIQHGARLVQISEGQLTGYVLVVCHSPEKLNLSTFQTTKLFSPMIASIASAKPEIKSRSFLHHETPHDAGSE